MDERSMTTGRVTRRMLLGAAAALGAAPALAEECIKGGLCMSGMYDMKPVRLLGSEHLCEIHQFHGSGDE